MAFVNFIENLQRKPYSVRFKFFFVAVLVSSALVIAGFYFSVKYSLHDSALAGNSIDKEEKSGADTVSLREALKSSIGEIFDFKNSFDKNTVDYGNPDGRDLKNSGMRLP